MQELRHLKARRSGPPGCCRRAAQGRLPYAKIPRKSPRLMRRVSAVELIDWASFSQLKSLISPIDARDGRIDHRSLKLRRVLAWGQKPGSCGALDRQSSKDNRSTAALQQRGYPQGATKQTVSPAVDQGL